MNASMSPGVRALCRLLASVRVRLDREAAEESAAGIVRIAPKRGRS